MKKTSFSSLLLAFSLSCSLMAGGQIERANVIADGNLSSILLDYTGVSRLTYFAFLRADRTLVVDFPGVASRFDWSRLIVNGLKSIQVQALNPDVEEGISLLMVLDQDTTYKIVEENGQLVFQFQSEISQNVVALTGQEQMTVGSAVALNITEQNLVNSDSEIVHIEDVFSKSIKGELGPNRLGQLDIQVSTVSGEIRLKTVSGKYKTFYLKEPNRFVVDLMDSVISLPEREVTLNNPYVSQIRIRQYQSQPSAIVRLVLDLNSENKIDVSQDFETLILHFGENTSSESVIKQAGKFIDHHETLSKEAVPLDQVEAVLGEDTQVINAIAQSTHIKEDETLQASDLDMSYENQNLNVDQAIANSADSLVTAGPDSLNRLEIANDASANSQSQNEVQGLPLTQLVEGDGINQVAETESIQGPVSQKFSQELPAPVSDLNSSQANAKPAFVPASDADQLLAEFENQGSLKAPLAEIVPNHVSRKRKGKPFVVTNEAIEAQKTLLEMRPMQSEQESSNGDSVFETIFQGKDSEFGIDRIEGEPTEYRGFEISVIDVKNVSVVDLLRFIADQVNINLYVDSSVTDFLKATYRFRNIPWDQAMDIILRNANLEKEFTNNVLRVATVEKFQNEERKRGELRRQREESVPTETVTVSLSYAKAKEVKPIIENYLSIRGRVLQDFRTNMLIIEDIPKRMVGIRALLKKLDRMVSQVSIESRIVETTKRFLRELGIQWGLSAKYSPELGTNTGVTFPQRVAIGGPTISQTSVGGIIGGYAVNFPVIQENPSGIGLTLGNFLDNFKLDISLQMLESDGGGQIIASPKVTTQNNQSALIKSGQLVPIQTIQRGTITIRYIEAVLQLKVTPHITAEETIIMDLEVTKSDLDLTQVINGNPIINTREATTQVLVKNGGTAVIGGIFSLTEQHLNRGIPGLRTVPLLRRLFSGDLKNFENKEMLIFVTPRIIKY